MILVSCLKTFILIHAGMRWLYFASHNNNSSLHMWTLVFSFCIQFATFLLITTISIDLLALFQNIIKLFWILILLSRILPEFFLISVTDKVSQCNVPWFKLTNSLNRYECHTDSRFCCSKSSQNVITFFFFKSLLADGFSLSSIPTTEQFNLSPTSPVCILQYYMNALLLHETYIVSPTSSSFTSSFFTIHYSCNKIMLSFSDTFWFLCIYVGYFLQTHYTVVEYITKTVKTLITVLK